MSSLHPFLRYAEALILLENNLSTIDDVNSRHLISEIEKGINSFRVIPTGIFDGKSDVKYRFDRIEQGNPNKGIFLSPNIITNDPSANKTWKNALELLQTLTISPLSASDKMTMSSTAISGDYLSFSEKNASKRSAPSKLIYKALGTITTLTKKKPSIQYRIDKKGSQPDLFNKCLIPDLPIEPLKDFILLFNRILLSRTDSDLMLGNVIATKSGKKGNEKITYEPKRPLIFKGNFPNPPRSSALGAIALLGAIGEFAKEAEYSDQAKRVLESLKNTEMYLVKYGGATVFTYNHHVIDLAKEGKLRTIVDSIYYSQLYKGKRFWNKDKNFDPISEYQKFDLFTSRFLQLFNHAAFKDFLVFRAEYPHEVTILFNTYFTKMEKIDLEIVQSARILGKWLNKVAYFAAKNEVKQGTSKNWEEIRKTEANWEEIRKIKAKVLVELESSTFSSKSGYALIAQAVTRAGRISGMDAPEGAALYMEKTASGELPLDAAKNLLIAFSRLINKSEKAEKKDANIEPNAEDEENLSNE